jgi:hypothetical protein
MRQLRPRFRQVRAPSPPSLLRAETWKTFGADTDKSAALSVESDRRSQEGSSVIAFFLPAVFIRTPRDAA